jgi:hypothetical protein
MLFAGCVAQIGRSRGLNRPPTIQRSLTLLIAKPTVSSALGRGRKLLPIPRFERPQPLDGLPGGLPPNHRTPPAQGKPPSRISGPSHLRLQSEDGRSKPLPPDSMLLHVSGHDWSEQRIFRSRDYPLSGKIRIKVLSGIYKGEHLLIPRSQPGQILPAPTGCEKNLCRAPAGGPQTWFF